MSFKRPHWIRSAMLALTVGAAFQLGGCSITGLRNFAQSINPCGIVLNCDPLEYRFLTSGYQGPGVNPEIDPACTFPPFCAGDPFVGGGGP